MIRIYRHSELIGVTHNRGKRDREHMPEFCISSLKRKQCKEVMKITKEGSYKKVSIGTSAQSGSIDRKVTKVKVGL